MTTQELVTLQLASIREDYRAHLALADKCEAIMLRLPHAAIDNCAIVCAALLIYRMDRATALEVISSLGGKWIKTVGTEETKITYTTEINGVTVQMWNAAPPESCRIETEEVYVPAHNETKRRLVCK